MKKRDARDVQSCCFAYSFQPIAFLTFSLSSPLWHLKVPINDDFFFMLSYAAQSLMMIFFMLSYAAQSLMMIFFMLSYAAQPLIRGNLY